MGQGGITGRPGQDHELWTTGKPRQWTTGRPGKGSTGEPIKGTMGGPGKQTRAGPMKGSTRRPGQPTTRRPGKGTAGGAMRMTMGGPGYHRGAREEAFRRTSRTRERKPRRTNEGATGHVPQEEPEKGHNQFDPLFLRDPINQIQHMYNPHNERCEYMYINMCIYNYTGCIYIYTYKYF